MELSDALHLFENYSTWLIVFGIGVLLISTLPRLFSDHPLSTPVFLLILGYLAVELPLGINIPHPQYHGKITEHLTEWGVIIALMGAGLKIDRKPTFKGWSSTWRLLGITMLITIALCAFLGWWFLAFAPATAVLLGAVIAPTDPVLASEVEVGPPGEGSGKNMDGTNKKKGHREDELRFSLTSEAGLNDGLAFPFTNMAIAMALFGFHYSNWLESWLLINVFYEIGIALIVGPLTGWLLSKIMFSLPAKTDLANAMVGMGALAATLIIYSITELLGGYGFIAVFVGAVTIRNFKRDHRYHNPMHLLTEKVESILTVIILIALGAAIASGLLDALNWKLVIGAVIIVLIIRPLAGVIGLMGSKRAIWEERLAISFFGIRGIGSIYYLAYALNKAEFTGSKELWSLVTLIIIISIFVHGISAFPVISRLDKIRERKNKGSKV